MYYSNLVFSIQCKLKDITGGKNNRNELVWTKRMYYDNTAHFCCWFQFEADRRAFIITINSFGTELGKDDRNKLYPKCGKLYPEGLTRLAKADDYEQVRAVADYYSVCRT